ncbi:hypothetical protein [Gynuella sp.]|uniref:hypothetical protein n=1 Tax=Gynuella sp. TaxID=2969146 RepID=UPI003D0BBECA
MKTILFSVVAFLAGAVVTLAILSSMNPDVDLLSRTQGFYIKTDHEFEVEDSVGTRVTVPENTVLYFASQYREEGVYFLKIVSSELRDQTMVNKELYFQVPE